ncbi:hypothetical protein EVG20_g1532 [Dentipellis fragilis]|uniref:Protein kinase domain-containing protein n=1 Tax=Dentipellis fragilis TaxID=205917 RepID=A0A4Y9ZAI6_9AGAM|nr:hypothetical protein EVG20_g1532 [Dentipellis fragilis]
MTRDPFNNQHIEPATLPRSSHPSFRDMSKATQTPEAQGGNTWPGWPDDEPALNEELDPSITDYATYLAILRRPERQWAKIQPWLQSQGYMLRPRFRPGWTPSWRTGTARKELSVEDREDAVPHDHVYASATIDAIRTSDGRHVCLKRIACRAEDSNEVSLMEFLSQPEQSKDPRNHAIPLLDVIHAPDHCFLVFPVFRALFSLEGSFDTIGEGFDLVSQTLEGLAYLHELRIAHRDFSFGNILMDAPRMFPHGFHFDNGNLDVRGRWLSGLRTRTQVGGVRYYLIDFGEAMRFGASDSVLIDVWSKASIHAPETVGEDRPPYDPFKADIYTAGETYRKMLIKDYGGYFDTLLPLIDSMTAVDPDARPTIHEALQQFAKIKASYSKTALHARAMPKAAPGEVSDIVAWPGWPEDEPHLEEDLHPPIVERKLARVRLRRPERQWRTIQPCLQSQGYMLRPRFRPGWVPSWNSGAAGKNIDVDKSEDSIPHASVNAATTIDAIRISDGRRVCLKRVPCRAEDSVEVAITTFLSQPEQREDSRNHAIPVLDVIRAPDHCFMVFPFYRTLISHVGYFNTIGEAFDMVDQTLEGLAYLHELKIAHRDISVGNILMDADRMFPHGFHLDNAQFDTRGRRVSGVRTRTQIGGVRYYLIDFGEAMMFGPSDDILIDVWSRASIHAPETLGDDRPPYDPFKADIYTTGETFRGTLVNEFKGYFDMLLPLVEAMAMTDPNGRPTASEALQQFSKVKSSYSRTALHARVSINTAVFTLTDRTASHLLKVVCTMGVLYHLPEVVIWPGWPTDEPYLDHDKRVIDESISESRAKLRRVERQWAKVQPWLQSKGYMLRPRFRQGWVPSWRGEGKVQVTHCEDAIRHVVAGSDVTIDAIRISDGRHVCLKRIPCRAEDSTEVAITEFLSQEEQRKDSRNHSIPLLDVIRAPDHCFMVFPFCRPLMYHEPPFNTIGEIFDMVKQALEGLEYLHELRIAHRDCSIANILMDPNRIFPHGFHMDHVFDDARGRELSALRTRTQVGGAKYYIIDFGESIKFGPAESILIDVWSKATVHAPETLNENRPPYDPFKADIYAMGESLKQLSVNDYVGYLDSLLPLFEAMTKDDPNGRLTASGALERLRTIRHSYSRTALHGRVRHRRAEHENAVERVFHSTWHWTKQCVFAISNLKW